MMRTVFGVGVLAAGLLAALGSIPARSEARMPRFRKHVIASGLELNGVIAADFNRDGRLDLAAAGPAEVAWYEGAGDTWTKHVIQARTAESGSVDSIWLTVHDVDGDGAPDLIAATPATGVLVWYQNPGDASKPWTRHLIAHLPKIHSQVLEDLDGDGRPELVANTDGALVWFALPRNPRSAPAEGAPGEGGWQRHTLTTDGVTGTPHYLRFADVPGHGRVLCAGCPDGGYLAWWERTMPGRVEARKLTIRPLPGASHLIPADVDGDGKLDLFYARGHETGMGWLSGPDWKTEHPIEMGGLALRHATALGDLNGDGRPDVAAVGRTAPGLHVWMNDGHGSFTQSEVDPTQRAMGIQITDLNRDGKADILVAGGEGKSLVWYEHQ